MTRAEFDRAVFLRHLAQFRAFEAHVHQVHRRADAEARRLQPLLDSLYGTLCRAERELPEYFASCMNSCGGMAGPGEVLQ